MKFSYSKLDLFDQCPMKYKFKYIDGFRTEGKTLALEMGSLAHKGKEMWGEYLIKDEDPDFNYIDYVLMNGIEVSEILIINGIEVEIKIKEDVLGINDLKNKYMDSYFMKCNKTGMTYKEKIKIYNENLNEKMIDGWKVLAVEQHFKFKYRDKYILNGFIDRIDINENGDLRVVDYKSSKEIYKSDKLATPLQMFIYTLACENMFNKQPIEHIYDFIFLGEQQSSCTKGYYNRGIKKLDKLLDKIEECKEKCEYIPKPTPLCFWCEFSGNTCTKDKELNGMCEYYSLWTRENKIFTVNKKWEDDTQSNENIKVDKREFIW